MKNLKEPIQNIDIPNTTNNKRFIIKNNIDEKHILDVEIPYYIDKYSIDLTLLDPHYNYDYFVLEESDDKWSVLIESKSLFPIFEDKNNSLLYSYYKYDNTKKLLVIFSSSSFRNKFNYFKTIKNINQSKLFIADENNLQNDTTSSYYIGKLGNLTFESKIYNLIEQARIDNNLSKRDVVLIGSSKGGFASIYYSFKYQYGYCIVGSPTIFLGKIHKETLRGKQIITHLSGEYTEKSLSWLNNLIIENVYKCRCSPKIYYHVGEYEPRYTRHALPFISTLNKNNFVITELDLGNYSNHSEVANHFPNFLKNTLYRII